MPESNNENELILEPFSHLFFSLLILSLMVESKEEGIEPFGRFPSSIDPNKFSNQENKSPKKNAHK